MSGGQPMQHKKESVWPNTQWNIHTNRPSSPTLTSWMAHAPSVSWTSRISDRGGRVGRCFGGQVRQQQRSHHTHDTSCTTWIPSLPALLKAIDQRPWREISARSNLLPDSMAACKKKNCPVGFHTDSAPSKHHGVRPGTCNTVQTDRGTLSKGMTCSALNCPKHGLSQGTRSCWGC